MARRPGIRPALPEVLGSVQTKDPRQGSLVPLFAKAIEVRALDAPGPRMNERGVVIDKIDEDLARIRDALGIGFHFTVSAPSFKPPFVQLTWNRLSRLRTHADAFVVQFPTLRECLDHVEEFERLADSESLTAAVRFHHADMKQKEGNR